MVFSLCEPHERLAGAPVKNSTVICAIKGGVADISCAPGVVAASASSITRLQEELREAHSDVLLQCREIDRQWGDGQSISAPHDDRDDQPACIRGTRTRLI